MYFSFIQGAVFLHHYFNTQIVLFLANESSSMVAKVYFRHVHIILWAPPSFLVQEISGSSYTFLAVTLESAFSSRSPGYF